jgi:hypothetical protein
MLDKGRVPEALAAEECERRHAALESLKRLVYFAGRRPSSAARG